MGVVDIEHRVVATRDPGELVQVGRVAGHAVDPVPAKQPGGGEVLLEQLLEVVGVLEAKSLHGRATGDGELTSVVDRLVGAVVHEDRAVPGQNGDDGQV